ncbi:MAG: hypothetical protein WAN50_02140 [Minisyncoccia bacterium]
MVPVFAPWVPIFSKYLGLFPAIGYYDLHIENHTLAFDWVYSWAVPKDDPLMPYISGRIPTGFTGSSVQNPDAYEIMPNSSYVISQIPLQIAVEQTSFLASCGFVKKGVGIQDVCPSHPQFPKASSLSVYATPNLSSWIVQTLLILVFWMVAINNFLEFVRVDNKRI